MKTSYSRLKTYRICPKQYEYAHIKKVPRPLGAGESFGVSMHTTLQRFGELELALRTPTSRAAQLTLFQEEHVHETPERATLQQLLTIWRKKFIPDGYASRAAMDEKFQEGEAALRHFFTWWESQPRDLVGIEQAFSLQIPESDIVINGRFDRVERSASGLLVIDYKTGTPMTQERLDKDLQLSVYALAAAQLWNEPVAALAILSLTSSECIERRTHRREEDLKAALHLLKQDSAGIGSEHYGATPSKAACSACPFRNICPCASRG